MTKILSDTATTILSAAAARDNHRILPLTKLKAPPVVVHKTLRSLLTDGLIEEVPAARDDEVWAQSDQQSRTLAVTIAGLAAVGIEAGAAPEKLHKARTAGRKPAGAANGARKAPRAPKRPGDAKTSKQDVCIALLRRGQGASIAEMQDATGWQAHSVRGFMSGALKRRLKLDVVSEKDRTTGERRYHIAALRA